MLYGTKLIYCYVLAIQLTCISFEGLYVNSAFLGSMRLVCTSYIKDVDNDKCYYAKFPWKSICVV